MLKTLRNRLILSHVLPLLIIVPLMGVALIYTLETRFLMPALSRELEGNARLLAAIAADQPEMWENPGSAQAILDDTSTNGAARVMLFGVEGQLIASTGTGNDQISNQTLDVPGLTTALAGETVTRVYQDQSLADEVIDVMVPIVSDGRQVTGVVRMTYRHATAFEELLQLRYLIAAILFVGLCVGAALGYVLALNISTPIQQVTHAIHDLAHGQRHEPLPQQGPQEIKQQLAAVNILLERLHSLEQARRQLLANLVHELGRPLGALRSSVHALTSGATEDPQLLDDILSGMDEEMARLQYLLEELTHLHGQVLGTLELERQPVVLHEWLPKVLRPWQELAREKGQQWEALIPVDLPTITADPLRLAQAIGNLTSNAIKYTPAGGTISVSAGTRDEAVWIRVSDTGPGIVPVEQQEIFTPFFRGNQEKRIKQGMGLGLNIARDLVVAHGGRIELESKPGAGSCFTIWIPQSMPALTAPTAQ